MALPSLTSMSASMASSCAMAPTGHQHSPPHGSGGMGSMMSCAPATAGRNSSADSAVTKDVDRDRMGGTSVRQVSGVRDHDDGRLVEVPGLMLAAPVVVGRAEHSGCTDPAPVTALDPARDLAGQSNLGW